MVYAEFGTDSTRSFENEGRPHHHVWSDRMHAEAYCPVELEDGLEGVAGPAEKRRDVQVIHSDFPAHGAYRATAATEVVHFIAEVESRDLLEAF